MATIQEMLAYDTLMSGDMMRRQQAMGIPPGKGGSPGQPYEAPKEDPNNPYVPAPSKPKKNQFMVRNRDTDELAEELMEEDTFGDPAEFPRNEELKIAGGPELGGTGRKLTLGEYKKMRKTATDNFMNSDFTDQDYLDFQRVLDTGRRQMFDGV